MYINKKVIDAIEIAIEALDSFNNIDNSDEQVKKSDNAIDVLSDFKNKALKEHNKILRKRLSKNS